MSIDGNEFNNTLTGTLGDDVINAREGNDTINATQGADIIDGGIGNDRITMIMGDATRFASYAAARTYIITNTSVTDSAGILNSSLTSIERFTLNTLGTGDFNDTIDASAFTSAATIPVIISTGDGDDTITATGLSDNIDAGSGSNWIDAGGGTDFVTVRFDNGLSGTLTVTGSAGQVSTGFADGSVNTVLNAEYLTIRGASATAGMTVDASALTGLPGQLGFALADGTNIVVGHDGVDFFSNSSGWTESVDTMSGNGGADIYDYTFAAGSMNGDTITDLDGDDIIDLQFNSPSQNGGSLAYLFIGNAEFSGVAGQYRYFASGGQTFLEIDTDGDGNANEILTISNGQFALGETSPGSNQLHIIGVSGTSGDDNLGGGSGDDTIYGQDGNDSINPGGGINYVDGGDGNDMTVLQVDDFAGATIYVSGSDGTIVTTQNGVQTNTVTNTEYVAIWTTDFNSPQTTIDASGVTGFTGILSFWDTNGSDTTIGSHGADNFGSVDGATLGNDVFTGNGGADVYDYSYSIVALNGDMITDFDADDTIDLRSVNNNSGLIADQFIGTADFSGVAGQYRYFAYDNQTFVQVDTDGDAIADQMLTIGNGQFVLDETAPGSNILQIVGTSGTGDGEFLVGTPGDDDIYAGGGNDTIAATGGMDHDYGGDGFDQLRFVLSNTNRFTAPWDSRTITITDEWVGASDGTVNTYHYDMESIYLSTVGTGDFGDTIDGSGATTNLVFRAGNGDDTIVGGSGDDSITTGLGINSVDAGDGYDVVAAQFDNNLGATVYVSMVDGAVVTTVDGVQTNSATNAEMVGAQGLDFDAGSVIDASGLTGFAGTFVFYDTNGTNIDIGSAGADLFANVNGGETGNDTYTGNGGADIYDYTYAVGAMDGDHITDLDFDDVIDLRFNDADQNGGGFLADQFIGLADFTGIAGQYRYFAVDGQTFVQVDTDGDGNADETLTIGNGQFVLAETAPGSNILQMVGYVGSGDDDFLLGLKSDDDVIYGQGGNDTIAATEGSDVVDGGDGWDQLRFRTDLGDRFTLPTGPLTYTITDDHVADSSGTIDTSLINIESIYLRTLGNGDFGDTVDASALTSAGLVLRLGTGNDMVIGGAGDDDIGMALGINTADAGAGFDTVYTAFDNTTGATAYITSSGGAVIATVDGVQVASLINAELVDITGFYASGVTTVIDASSYEAIPGVQLVLRDSNGSDTIIGSDGNDILANVSNNTLGNDVFTGGAGADVFDYTYASNGINGDTITDFSADDTIDFRFNNGDVEGASPLLCNLFIGGSQFTGHAGEYRYTVSGSTTLIQVDTDGDAVADQTLTIANGAFALGETAPGSNILKIVGSSGTSGADTLTGTLGDDSIFAQGSSDIINGSQGNDFVDGGNGIADRLFMNTGDASLFTLATGARTYTIGASTITDSSGTLNTSFTGVERIAFSTIGNGDFDDVIDASGYVSGHSAGLDIRLGNGDNIVTGSSTNDRIFTGFGGNIIDGGNGYDFGQVNVDASSATTVTITNVGGTVVTNANGVINQLTGFEEVWVNGVGGGAITLDASGYTATPGVDLYLIGHNGTDVMIGSTGNDFFANTTGQVLGNDVYTGNGGADIYDYTYAADSMNGDTITDFDIDDVIDFRFNTLLPGQSPILANHFIGDAAFSGTAGEYRYQIDGTTTIVQVDSDGDTVVDQTLTISNGGFELAETFAGSNILTLAAVINPLDGVVADGYLAGATLFVDVNGNKQLDSGEAWTITDAAGNFSLNVNQAGTLVAIGGTNADTGLANTMTLMAPSDSGVVNPLTTLVQAVVEASGGTTTADQAVDQVLAALGLDPSLDLLNVDLLAQGSDPAALEAQKAAAMIANLVSTAEGVPGSGANTESALIGALAELVADTGPGETVDLTDSATLTPLLTEALPGVTNVTAIANEVAIEGDTIAAATSLDDISDAQLDAALIDYSLDNVLTGDSGANHLYGLGGNDTLSGLAGNDFLEGGVGNDILKGGSGFDFLWGGSGNDTFVAENSTVKEQTKVGALSMDVIFDFAAGDRIDLRDIDANAALAGNQLFNFRATNANKLAGDLSYKVYDSVMGAEKALGHDIDGVTGASPYSGPVTIVYGNVDGGTADFAIALIGVNGVKASDFLFA